MGVAAGCLSLLTSPAQAEPTSLKDYVLSRAIGEPDDLWYEAPSFTETLLDEGGRVVRPGSDGKYRVHRGETYYWELDLYAPAGMPHAGTYVYELPDLSDDVIFADDGTVIGLFSLAGDGRSLSLTTEENTKIRVSCRLQLAVMFSEGEDGTPIDSNVTFVEPDSTEAEVTLEKSGEVAADGSLEWEVRAQIPAYKGDFTDDDFERYNLVEVCIPISIEAGPYSPYILSDAEDLSVTLTWGGVTHVLPTYGEVAPDDSMSYVILDNVLLLLTRIDRFVPVGSAHSCDIYDDLDDDDTEAKLRELGIDTETWCRCWMVPEIAELKLTYRMGDMADLDPRTDYLLNTAVVLDKSALATVYLPSGLTKESGADGAFVVTVNAPYEGWDGEEALVDLTGTGPIEVRDDMADGLAYERGSMRVTATGTDGVARVLSEGADYELVVDEDGGGFTLSILDLGQFTYEVIYRAVGSAGADGAENTATCTLYGRKWSDSAEYRFFSSAEEYALTIEKTDEETGEPVAGATYGVFSNRGELLGTAVTGEGGRATFLPDPTHGFVLVSGYLYYVQELEAPKGYELSDERTWWCYEGTDPADLEGPRAVAELEGLMSPEDEIVEVAGAGLADVGLRVSDRRIPEPAALSLQIRKTDSESGAPVAGATYGVFSAEGELLAEATTDDDGRATFSGPYLSSGALYYVSETAAPEGYALSAERYWLCFDGSDVDALAAAAGIDPAEVRLVGDDGLVAGEPLAVEDERLPEEEPPAEEEPPDKDETPEIPATGDVSALPALLTAAAGAAILLVAKKGSDPF